MALRSGKCLGFRKSRGLPGRLQPYFGLLGESSSRPEKAGAIFQHWASCLRGIMMGGAVFFGDIPGTAHARGRNLRDFM